MVQFTRPIFKHVVYCFHSIVDYTVTLPQKSAQGQTIPSLQYSISFRNQTVPLTLTSCEWSNQVFFPTVQLHEGRLTSIHIKNPLIIVHSIPLKCKHCAAHYFGKVNISTTSSRLSEMCAAFLPVTVCLSSCSMLDHHDIHSFIPSYQQIMLDVTCWQVYDEVGIFYPHTLPFLYVSLLQSKSAPHLLHSVPS